MLRQRAACSWSLSVCRFITGGRILKIPARRQNFFAFIFQHGIDTPKRLVTTPRWKHLKAPDVDVLVIDEPVFQHSVEIVVGLADDAAVLRYLIKHHDAHTEVTNAKWGGQTITVDDVPNRVFVLLNDFDLSPYSVGVLVHELFHAVHMIYDQIGLAVREDGGQESHAYLLGWLTQTVLEACEAQS